MLLGFFVLLAGGPAAAVSSTSTTTTLFDGTTTTTMFVPTDVTGGGDFEGGFPVGSFDSYTFTLTEPRVLIAEVTNGFGGCPGDSYVELRQLGAPGNCMGMYGDELPCIAFDDDGDIAVCSKLVKYIATPGTYEIRVRHYDYKTIIRYFLHVEFVEIECGNGELELTEGCDDGNSADGDCCSSACQVDAEGMPCSDGLFCNGDDTCDADGVCSVHAGSPCTGPDGDGDCAESCTDAEEGCLFPDPNGSPCDDGVFCNGADTCLDGSCSVHAGDPCPGPDGDGNCSEACDEETDACTAADPDETACNDNKFCNGADTCGGGTCSVHAGDPCPGADGDADCSESCAELVDACVGSDPNGTACVDSSLCTITVRCNGAGTCVGDEVVDCDDGDDCTADQCNDVDGTCSHVVVPACLSTTTTTLPGLVCGDVSGDGSVKASDALGVLKGAVGGSECDAEPCVCDANGSGSISAADALLVLRLAVGAPAEPACPC